MFIHDRLGRRKDATGAIVDLIRVASSSGMGSTHLIGHELGHNLMSIARDAGVITEAQQKELDALFTDKNGKFDEEAFAEAFARELKRAFFETVQKRMEDVPATKAGRALRRVADFVVTLARSFAFWRQERGLDPVTGQPLQSGQVLDAFLKRERTAVDEATQEANAARAAEARATQEAMANAPTQTVVDEDGTEVAYHEAERGDRDVTAEDFARTFGMYAPYSFAERSDDDTDFDLNKIQFDGVAKEVAQAQANGAYDGLMAIAKVMGVPPDTLGLGGLISPNFGATHSNSGTRGFYLPARGELVLPTTVTWEQVKDNRRMLNVLRWWLLNNARNDLAKSTAIHEWMHALDMALASGRDADWRNEGAVEDGDVRARDPKTGELGGAILEPRALSFPNGRGNNVGYPISDSVRPEVRAAFDRMMGAIMDSSYGKRQANAKVWLEQYKDEIAGDVGSTAENLSKPNEVLARAFEQVIAEESGSIGARKYFETAYENPDMADALAYPTSEEVRELLPIFREFFSALKVGVNETTGAQTLYHIKVWSGAGQAYDRVDFAYIGSGTGGNNEGRGAYSSGVRGVAQGRYAMYKVKAYKEAAKLLRYKGGNGRFLEKIGNTAFRSEDEFWDAFQKFADIVDEELSAGRKITRNKDGDYIVAGITVPKNIALLWSAGMLHAVDTDGIVDAWVGRLIPTDYRDDDSYDIALQNYKDSIEVYESVPENKTSDPSTGFYISVLEDYMKSKEGWLSLLDLLLPKLEKASVNLPRPAVMEQTWFTNRPEGDVSHLLNWFEAVTPEQMGWILDGARKAGFSEEEIAFLQRERIDDDDVLIEDGNRMPSGREMYMRLELIASVRKGGVAFSVVPLAQVYAEVVPLDLWTAHEEVMGDEGKFASEFFVSADIDGMMYPVDYRHGNRDGRVSGWNYVAFSDEHLRVDHVYEYNPETDDFELKWHESEGGASLRFTETPLGQELVAKAFDAIVGSRVDLLLRPSRYYGNPYETSKRNPRDGLVVEKLGREIDVSEPKGFAAEVSAEISRFGTREGDPTLREIRARCGSKARFYEVLGAVYETAEAVRSGLAEVVTGRERAMMENAGLQAADFIKHNATARATALGRKLYLMGREFAWKLYQEDIAAARAEVERQRRKASEARGETRAAKAQTRNAERREETARNQAYQNRWGLAEERFMREYERALLRHQAARKVSDVREKMQEQVDLLRLREAKKRALERERGVTFTALKATLGVDIPARLRALAGTQEDPFEAAAKLIVEIDDGFDKWVKRDRRDLLDGTEPYTYLNEQGERAYAETMGNVLKAVARDLSYGKLREALLNAADKIARAKPETVRVIVEGKLGRVARVLRLAQNADIVTLARRRIKSALAEANKRLSSANSGMRTRYMTAMRKQAKELIKTMQLAVSAQDNTKASEKKRYAMLAERARLAEELKVIESGKTPDDLAKDETLTDRQHQDAVKLMFLEKFGDLSYTIDPAEVWAKAAEAEGFVVS